MKFSTLSLLTIIGVASAGRPQLSITVSDGNFAGIDGLDPSISWSGESKTGDVDIEYGIDLAARPTTDVASLPKKIWGKASTDVGGWGTSISADVEGTDFAGTEFELDAANGDMSLKLSANSGGVQKVEASKGFSAGDADVTVNPRYDVPSQEADVVVTYDAGDTNVELTASVDAQSVKIEHQAGDTNIEVNASMDEQSLTISQQLDADNRIAPTITSTGDISVEWERSLGDDNSLTATVKPNDSVDLEWKDADWTANINLPVEGTSITGANVSVKRDVTF
jgi:hypothetical protein